VELVDLSDCKVADWKLRTDSNDTNDEEVSNLDNNNVGYNVKVCLQTMDQYLGRAIELMPAPLGFNIKSPSEASATNIDPFFNAVGKALFLMLLMLSKRWIGFSC
jgi:hypothetical protein